MLGKLGNKEKVMHEKKSKYKNKYKNKGLGLGLGKLGNGSNL